MIPDNLDRFERHDAEQERQLQKLPKCDWCGEPIQEEYFFLVHNEFICPECMDECRKRTEDYMKGF